MVKDSIIFNGKSSYGKKGFFGWQKDKDMLFYGLTEGYKNSADDLVNIVLDKGDLKTLDTYCFPIIFLYRHYIELELKRCNSYLGFKNYNKHFLMELFTMLISDINKNYPSVYEYIKNGIREIDGIILEFDAKDNKGDTFRYLLNTKNDFYFKQGENIDYINIKSSINKVYYFFQSIYNIPQEKIINDIYHS